MWTPTVGFKLIKTTTLFHGIVRPISRIDSFFFTLVIRWLFPLSMCQRFYFQGFPELMAVHCLRENKEAV
jgi:hypothetical protein